MSAAVCLIVTPAIRDLAKKIPGELPKSVANLVSLYNQDHNITDLEYVPGAEELVKYRDELRNLSQQGYARIDFGDRFGELVTEENLDRIYEIARTLGVLDMSTEGTSVVFKSSTVNPTVLRALKAFVADIVFKEQEVTDIFGRPQERLDAYYALNKYYKENNRISSISAISPWMAAARASLNNYIDLRSKEQREYEEMEKGIPETIKGELFEGIASWFSDILTQRYNDYIQKARERMAFLEGLKSRNAEEDAEYEALGDEINISRREYLDQVNPETIFDEIKKRLNDYSTADDKALRKIIAKNMHIKEADVNDTILQNYRKICSSAVKCFDIMKEKAGTILATTELIQISRSVVKDITQRKSDEDPENEMDDDDRLAEGLKETWMYEYDTVSNYSKLPVQVRHLLASLPYLTKRGNQTYTMLGTARTLPVNAVLPMLLEELHGVHDSVDIIPVLSKMAKANPWVDTLIAKLNADPQLLTMFANTMNRARKTYAVADVKGEGIRVDIINRKGRSNSISKAAVAQILSKTTLTSHSVYTKHGKLNKKEVESGLEALEEIDGLFTESLARKKREGGVTAALNDFVTVNKGKANDPVKKIAELLNNAGFAVTRNDVVGALLDPNVGNSANGYTRLTAPLKKIYEKLNGFSDAEANDTKAVVDIVTAARYEITDIAFALSNVETTAVEPSIRQNGKTRYSHVLPSDLDLLIEGLNGELYSRKNEVTEKKSVKEYVEEKYGYDSYYFDKNTGRYRSMWLQDIANGDLSLDYIEVLDYTDGNGNTSTFERWDRKTFMDMHYAMWRRKNEHESKKAGGEVLERWYPIPVPSDSQTLRYVKAKEYSHSELVVGVATLIMQEVFRMRDTENMEHMPENYRKNKDIFCMLPSLNSVEGGPVALKDRLLNLAENDRTGLKEELNRLANDILNDEIAQYFKDNVEEAQGLNDEELSAFADDCVHNRELVIARFGKDVGERLIDTAAYVENSMYAQSQMVELFIGDPAFFEQKNGGVYTDLQKRFKQVIVPKTPIDAYNKYANEGQDKPLDETCLYLSDEVRASSSIEDITKLYKAKLDAGEITQKTYDSIVKEFSHIKTTDGQAYRTINGLKKLLYMQGVMKPGDALDVALDKLRNNEAGEAEFAVIRESGQSFVQKPFTSGILKTRVGVDTDGNPLFKAMPIQHKNSEQLLTAALRCAEFTLGKSEALKQLMEFADENDIDVIMFESAVKVGANDVVVMPEMTEKNQAKLKRMLKKTLKNNPSIVHKVPYSMYGTVSSVPVHGIDAEINIGTQLQKLITEDIPDGAVFNYNGRMTTKSQILAEYNALYTEKIMRAYRELIGNDAKPGTLMDKRTLSRMLQDAVKLSSRGSSVLERAFQLDENDNFVIPLCDLSTINMSSEFLNSIIRKAVTKMKMPGGQFVQMSSFGLTDELKIEFEYENETPVALKAIQCYLPAYTKEFLKKYADENGYIDITKVPEEMRRALGFRIPTSGKYFMCPLHIMGFLPDTMPTTAVFASDIVPMMDSDFDVDKMPTLLPSIIKAKYDREAAYQEWKNLPEIKEAYKEKNKAKRIEDRKGLVPGSLDVELPFTFNEWYNEHKKEFKTDDGELLYAHSNETDPQKLSDEQLNNRLLECMTSMLTSPAVATQVINVGGTYAAKAAAETIKSLRGRTKERRSPASINSVIKQQDENNAGKNMIAVFAVANAMHALCQNAFTDSGKRFSLKNEFAVSLFGEHRTDMTGTRARDGILISEYIGTMLNAGADNAKEATMYELNVSDKTCNAAALLLRLGYTINDVGKFLNIPAIREYVENSDSALSAKADAFLMANEGKEIVLPSDVNINDVLNGSVVDENYGMTALAIFKRLQEVVGQDMHDIDMLCRSDSGAGAPHGSLENNLLRILKIFNYVNNNKSCFNNWDLLVSADDLEFTSPKSNPENTIKKSKVPIAQAFTSCGVFGSYKIFSEYYPGFHSDTVLRTMVDVIERCHGGKYTINNVRSVLYALFDYYQTGFASLRKDGMTVDDTRKWYTSDVGSNNFITNAKEIIQKYPALQSKKLIKNLMFGNADANTPFVELTYEGALVKDVREQFISDWKEMLYSKNPEIREFAKDLYRYSFYRNGFQFANGSFAHLAPVEARTMIDGYVEEMQESLDMDRQIITDEMDKERFLEQYRRNKLYETRGLRSDVRSTKFYLDRATGKPLDIIFPEEINKSEVLHEYMFIKAISIGSFYVTHNKERLFYIAVADGNGDYMWIRTEPLGWGSKAMEFNRNVPSTDLESVYDKARVIADLNNKGKRRKVTVGSDAPTIATTSSDDMSVVDFNALFDRYHGIQRTVQTGNPAVRQTAIQAKTGTENSESRIVEYNGKWTRESVRSDDRSLYIFTDNTDRDSGSLPISPNSWYSHKYGEGHHFPTMTAAVIRGLPNAFPISTQRWYNNKAKGDAGRWNDSDIAEFKKVISDEIAEIIRAWNAGEYSRIVLPSGGLFGGKISAITKERTPMLYEYLQEQLNYLQKFVDDKAFKYEDGEPYNVYTTEKAKETTIEYTPVGKTKQTYTIRGSHIFNKDGVEVFKEDSRDRNKIFANLAVRQGRAVVVEHRGINYIVNDKGQIMTTAKSNNGAIMNWAPNNGDRIAVMNKATAKFRRKAQERSEAIQKAANVSQFLNDLAETDGVVKANNEYKDASGKKVCAVL